MKQTVEEAAIQEAAMNNSNDVYGGKSYSSEMMIKMFKAGAEWQYKQSPWINVKERLPEEGQKVFVLTMCCGISRILIERFYKTSAFDKDNRWVFGNSIVLAWMPIPAFDDILEENRDVLERIKEKGD